MKRTFSDWLIATRPWSFPASSMPIVVAFAYLFFSYGSAESLHWGFGLLAITAIIAVHTGGNLISDYYDYKSGVDNPNAVCVQTIVSGLFSPTEILRYGLCCLALGISIGLYLVIFYFGVHLLLIGLFGTATALLYYFFKSRALGDLLIFLAFGPMAMLGAGVVMTGEIVPMLIPLSLPIGFITVGILHVNNTRDIASDTAAGIRTLASVIGLRRSITYYHALLIGAALVVIVMAALQIIPRLSIAAVVVVSPLIVRCVKTMSRARVDTTAIRDLDAETARLQMAFSLALSITMVVPPLAGTIFSFYN